MKIFLCFNIGCVFWRRKQILLQYNSASYSSLCTRMYFRDHCHFGKNSVTVIPPHSIEAVYELHCSLQVGCCHTVKKVLANFAVCD